MQLPQLEWDLRKYHWRWWFDQSNKIKTAALYETAAHPASYANYAIMLLLYVKIKGFKRDITALNSDLLTKQSAVQV